jgi:hypothetical protein
MNGDDQIFLEALAAHLPPGSPIPIIARAKSQRRRRSDGLGVDAEKTIELPCYAGLKEQIIKEIGQSIAEILGLTPTEK